MAANSRIEWADVTWNPVTGCTPVSPGCLNCYAARDAVRMAGNPNPKISGRYKGLAVVRDGRPVFNGTIRLHEDRLADPLRWRKPRMVFVNSQSDLFHDDVPFEFIDRVFAVMALCQQHTFQVLTKRPERMAEYIVLRGKNADYWKSSVPVGYSLQFQQFSLVRFPLPNVWLGASAENQECFAERLPYLLRVPAAVRFLSCEPLLGPIDLVRAEAFALNEYDTGIHWVIVGGESGPHARATNLIWHRDILRQCRAAGAPCFVKQLGKIPISQCSQCGGDTRYPACGPTHAAMTSELGRALETPGGKGGEPSEWPAELRVREWPAA